MVEYGEGVCDGGNHLHHRAVYFKYLRKLRYGEGDSRELVQYAPDSALGGADRTEHISVRRELGGAGALVPITGFANGVAAPAIEFQKEGQIFGIGCKIFTIAGPVILYGVFSSWIAGLIYWIGKMLGMF